jgi:hypothetical protein
LRDFRGCTYCRLGGLGFRTLGERSEEAANAPLATLKVWPDVTVGALANGMAEDVNGKSYYDVNGKPIQLKGGQAPQFHLQTIWRGGRVYYQLEVKGYPPSIREAKQRGTQAAFSIVFLDKDGFKLFEHALPLADMADLIGADGQPSGMSWKGDESVVVDFYRRAANWELSWSSFPTSTVTDPVAPPKGSSPKGDWFTRNGLDNGNAQPLEHKPAPAARPRWKDVSLWRGLGHGMSKGEVEKILGSPEKVNDLGFQVTWYYGYPEGGKVDFDRDGKLESWSEP